MFFSQNMWNPNGADKVWKALKTSFLQKFKIQMGLTRFGKPGKTVFLQILLNPNGPDKNWNALKTSFFYKNIESKWD